MTWDIFLFSELAEALLIAVFAYVLISGFFTAVIFHDEGEAFCKKYLGKWLGLLCVGFVLWVTTILVVSASDALVDANKNRLMYRYTSEPFVKEKVEPILEGFIEAIEKQIENPTIKIQIEKGDK